MNIAMTQEEEFKYDTLWFLEMIKSELKDHPNNKGINFPFKNQKVTFSETGEIPSHDRQIVIINDLEKQKVLIFVNKKIFQTIMFPEELQEERIDALEKRDVKIFINKKISKENASTEKLLKKGVDEYNFLTEGGKHIQDYLVIFKEKFDKVYKKKKEAKKEQSEKNKDNNFFVFNITNYGSLSRKNEISGDRPYKMGVGKLRHGCILELIKAQNKSDLFYRTDELANVLNTTEDKVRDAMAGIKLQTEKSFKGIRRNDFIESSKNSGYRLHKQIRIIKT